MIGALRDAAWMRPWRMRAWAAILLAGFAASFVYLGAGPGLLDPFGRPLGTDFSSFYTASRLALDGRPMAAWDVSAHQLMQRDMFGPAAPYYAFFYPPPFLLAVLPLALLPYAWALAAWVAATFALWWATIRPLLPERWAILPLLAFPAVFVNASHGQNGFLTAALLGAAALALGRRPVLAGLCIGLLAIKPHLGLAIPVALLAARRWAAFWGAAAGVALVGLAALAVFGTGAWQAFLANAALARETMEAGLVAPEKMVSVFAAVRLLGGDPALAYAVQAVAAICVLVLLERWLRRRPGGVAEIAAVAAATPLVSPFLLDYDLMVLGLPLAFVLAAALRGGGFLPWEKLVLLAAFVLPLASRGIGTGFGVPVAPLVTAALLWVVARRLALMRDGGVAPARAAPPGGAFPWEPLR